MASTDTPLSWRHHEQAERDMAKLSMTVLQLALGHEDNLSILEDEIDQVMKRFPWTQMVVLPELCTYGANTGYAVCLPGEVENCFREAARKHGIWLIPGSLFERRDNRIFNTTPVIDPEGVVIARYRKHYPFLPFEAGVSPGDQFVVFDVPGVGRVAVIICYDMWVPEMLRTVAWMGAEAVICPSLTNTIDRELEISISRANAAIHQVYFLNNNSAGPLGVGRSVFADPDGRIVHLAGSGREIMPLEIDFEKVRRIRERGLMGLCQITKSFRDRPFDFPPYREGMKDPGSFANLGPLEVPPRETNVDN